MLAQPTAWVTRKHYGERSLTTISEHATPRLGTPRGTRHKEGRVSDYKRSASQQ